MQITCKMCLESFGQLGSHKQPRVIPCGHSFCEQCLNMRLQVQESFQCEKCVIRHQTGCITYAPVNKLYYEIIQQLNEFLKKRQWEKQYFQEQNDSQKEEIAYIDPQLKCLYTFCPRVRYERDGVQQLFCSAKCMQLNEALYQKDIQSGFLL